MDMVIISQPLSFNGGNDHLRDASFSSYLNGSENTLVQKLAESSVDTNYTTTSPHEDVYLGRKKADNGEIGVFGAEKYFNGAVDEENPRVSNSGGIENQCSKNEPIDTSRVKPKTPSVHSESSWNSQSGLVPRISKNQPQGKTHKKRHGKSILASFGCSCACNGKNSIDIDESDEKSSPKTANEPVMNGPDKVDLARTNEARMSPWLMEEVHCMKIDEVGIGLMREECFTFPVLNSKVEIPGIENDSQEHEDEKNRNSLEVFGSPVLDKKTKSSSLDRRPNLWTLDSNSRQEEFEIPDNESEASSDLFEIESFTNSRNSFLLRQESDRMSTTTSVAPTTCYAPSEVSIEWSVVTASAAEFSVVSDSEDFVSSAAMEKARKMARNSKGSAAAGKEMEKWRSGILLSCKSHKAVKVAGDVHRTVGKAVNDPRRQHRANRGIDLQK